MNCTTVRLRFNWLAIGSLVLNLILILLLCTGWLCRKCECEEVGTKKWTEVVPVKEDTVTPIVLKNEQPPVPKKVTRHTVNRLPTISGPLYSPTDSEGLCVPLASVADSCSDEVFYSDTLYQKDNYRFIVDETVMGNRIKNRKVLFYNLAPKVIEHEKEVVKESERVRLYGGLFFGAQFGYNNKGLTGWSAGPSLLLTIPAGAALSVSYDARNNAPILSAYYKIKLRK